MGPPAIMEVPVNFHNPIANPGIGARRVCTPRDDLIKGAVDGRRVVFGRFAQAAGNLKPAGQQDATAQGRPPRRRTPEFPRHLIVGNGHRKDTFMEGRQH